MTIDLTLYAELNEETGQVSIVAKPDGMAAVTLFAYPRDLAAGAQITAVTMEADAAMLGAPLGNRYIAFACDFKGFPLLPLPEQAAERPTPRTSDTARPVHPKLAEVLESYGAVGTVSGADE